MKKNNIFKYIKALWSESNEEIDNVIKPEIDKINFYLKDSRLKKFIDDYEELLSSHNSDLYFSTLGINFKNDSVYSVKFYAHILDEISEEQLLKFVKLSEGYKKFLTNKTKGSSFSKKNLGTVLEIKFKVNSEIPTYGFFYLLDNNEDSRKIVGSPQKLPLEVKNNFNAIGINFEYEGEDQKFKRYYYFNETKDKLFFEKKLGIPLLGQFVEYAEGNDLSKVNTYSGVIKNFLRKDKSFSKKERKIIKFLMAKYNISIMTHGIYVDQPIKSIYFREGSSKVNNLNNMRDQHSNIFRAIQE